MAGEPLLLPRPRVVGVELTGVPDPGITGFDVLLALERRLAGEGSGAVLEFSGVGLLSLPVPDRLGLAARAGVVTGALAALFPSDDRTRGWLRECGRDADWRRLEGPDAEYDARVSLDLSAVRAERSESTAVRVGVFAEDEDVHGLARALARSRRAPDVALEVVVPGRVSLAAWTATGTLATLRQAGATILDRADPVAASTPAGAVLLGGEPLEEAARERGVWRCAALLTGSTPAEAMVSAGPAAPPPVPVWDDVLEPAGGEVERGPHHRQGRLPPLIDEPFRAVVLLEAGDDAAAMRLLAWGPRAWAARADADELAAALFRSLDPEAPAHARALGASVVVAGGGYGGGRHSEAVARASAVLGVRAVIAASYSGGHDRLLALHGVLPLTWLEPGDRNEVRAGDELEIPPPPASPMPGGRISVRHLTRGFTFDVRCDLEVPLRELARAGGLLRAVRDAMLASES
jgi:aconitate hydratase